MRNRGAGNEHILYRARPGAEAGLHALVKEMAEMRVKVTASGREQYGAWREGQHDDMILAVTLACWGAKKHYPRALSGVEAYCGRWSERVGSGGGARDEP